MLRTAGFTHIDVAPKPQSAAYIKDWLPGSKAEDYVISANVTATKPAATAAAAAATPAAAQEAAAAVEQMPSRMRKAVEKQAADASC